MTTLRRAAAALLDRLPEPLAQRLTPPRYRYDPASVPPPLPQLPGSVRVLIAHANYAEQGWRIARALEKLDGVSATAAQLEGRIAGYGFHSDYGIPARVYQYSRRWRERFRDEIAQRYTHVIIESARPLFGALHQFDTAADALWLRERGVRVGFLLHGSEIRMPSRHETQPWSPFPDLPAAERDRLERQSHETRAVLHQVGAPVFVTTPDLLVDWPGGVLTPLIAPSGTASGSAERLEPAVQLRVVHAPTNRLLKGSDLIEPAVLALADQGIVSYDAIEGLTREEAVRRMAAADVVLEQFRIGTYSTVAVEALASGRLVVGYLHDQARDAVRDRFGVEVPIIQAEPTQIADVLRDIAADPGRYEPLRQQARQFVDRVHSGRATAEAIQPFLRAPVS